MGVPSKYKKTRNFLRFSEAGISAKHPTSREKVVGYWGKGPAWIVPQERDLECTHG